MGTYTAEYINKLEQYESVMITLVLTDAEGIMPQVRIEKSFMRSKYTVSETLLSAIAEEAAQQALSEYEASLLVEEPN